MFCNIVNNFFLCFIMLLSITLCLRNQVGYETSAVYVTTFRFRRAQLEAKYSWIKYETRTNAVCFAHQACMSLCM